MAPRKKIAAFEENQEERAKKYMPSPEEIQIRMNSIKRKSRKRPKRTYPQATDEHYPGGPSDWRGDLGVT